MAVISRVAPGGVGDKLQEVAIEIITKGLVELGILTGKVSN